MDVPQQSKRALRRHKALVTLIGFLALGLAVLGWNSWSQPPSPSLVALPAGGSVRLALLRAGPRERLALDQPAPDFALAYANGQTLRLSELRGSPVVLNFWATWCTPCKAEMPELEALYRETGGGSSFEILAINMREAPEPVASYGEELRLTFPLVVDPDGLLSTSYRVTVLPTTVVIDAQGIVREQHLGPLTQTQLRELLATLP